LATNTTQKFIYVYGFARGGTNILWNILQSHPQVVSPIKEMNQILGRKTKLPKAIQKKLISASAAEGFHKGWMTRMVNKRMAERKQANLTHPENREQQPGVQYTAETLTQAAICAKGINEDYQYLPLLAATYEQLYPIGLVRDGFALCESMVRRGFPFSFAVDTYLEIGKQLMQAEQDGQLVIRFEQMIETPFAVAESCYSHCQLTPEKLEQLRLKVKKTLQKTGEHDAAYGTENKKYWFTAETIGDLLNPDINQTQKAQLGEQDREEFGNRTLEVLEYFGYA